ncbi:MAG: hypothetical protein ACLQM6_13605 [Acidobacteriaceae bacterium]
MDDGRPATGLTLQVTPDFDLSLHSIFASFVQKVQAVGLECEDLASA